MKQKLYHLLEPSLHRQDRSERLFDAVIVGLILLSVGAVILLTDPTIAETVGGPLQAFQWFATVVFTIEYLLRVYVCTADPKYAHPVLGRVRFMLSPMAMVDLLAILPFYLVALLAPSSDLAGAMLMLRMLRLLKLFRYSTSLMVFAQVLREKANQLLAGFLMTGVLLVIASSLVYFAERKVQPGAFESIPQTMWWGIVTLTTVGYGDVSPVTPLGQLAGAITAVFGIGLVALPSGILASGFIETFESADEGGDDASQTQQGSTGSSEDEACPRCGQSVR